MNQCLIMIQNQNKERCKIQEDLESRNEVFEKAGSDPIYKDRKPLGGFSGQIPKSSFPNSMAHKSKNMHTKINRGISPNQPPQSKLK